MPSPEGRRGSVQAESRHYYLRILLISEIPEDIALLSSAILRLEW